MSEIELKLLLDPAGAEAIWPRAVALGLAAAVPEPVRLESTYFDTQDEALRKAGVALRLRRKEDRWLQTVKTGRAIASGLSQAQEMEVPVAASLIDLDAFPDRKLARRLARLIGGEPLSPVLVTVVDRRAAVVETAGARIEVAVDAAEIAAGGHKSAIRELELELLEGEPAALFALADRLLPEAPLTFSRLSKSDRGHLLARTGAVEPPPAVRKAVEVPLRADDTAGKAARAILRECLDQIALNIPVILEAEDPEGPHQMRVGLRRLRSALSIFADAVEAKEAARLAAEAKWLAGAVGRLRDIDAVAADVVAPLSRGELADPGFARLTDALVGRATEERRGLRVLFGGQRMRRFLLDLACLVEAGPADAAPRAGSGIAAFARRALDRRWKKACRTAADPDALDIEGRHELRKELKRLRYAIEFFAPLYRKKAVARFVDHLKDLQAVLGGVIDARTARDLLREDGFLDSADPDLQRAAGFVIGASRARAAENWRDAGRLWHELEKTPLFWR